MVTWRRLQSEAFWDKIIFFIGTFMYFHELSIIFRKLKIIVVKTFTYFITIQLQQC